MKTIRLQYIVLTLAGLLCWSAGAAEPVKKSEAKKPAKSAFRTAGPPVESWHFDAIAFEGNRMTEVVEFLRDELEATGANFILSDDVADVVVNLQLKNVEFEQLTTALEIASGGRVQIESVDGSLYHIRPGEVRVQRQEPVMRVFNLSKYLQGKEDKEAAKAIEDLHQTAEMAFEMLSVAQRSASGARAGNSRMSVNSKFHPGTKLMIVVGSPQDVEIFHEVTSQLIGEPRRTVRRSGDPFGAMGLSGGAGGGMGGFGYSAGGMDAGGHGFEGGGGGMYGGGLPGTPKPRPSGAAGMSDPFGGGQQKVKPSRAGGGGGAPAQDPFAGPKKGR